MVFCSCIFISFCVHIGVVNLSEEDAPLGMMAAIAGIHYGKKNFLNPFKSRLNLVHFKSGNSLVLEKGKFNSS